MDTTGNTTEMRRKMRADARRNYARLLTAAAEIFAEQGAGASLEDIAARAGVGIGTLYRHFPSRQALLEAVYREHIEALGAEAQVLGSVLSPGEALATWLRSVLAHNVAQRGLKEALMREGGSELTAACKRQLQEAGAALLAEAQQAGDVRPDLEITDLLRLLYGIALAIELAPDRREQADRLLAIMLDGLRSQQPVAP